jgi:hypothetical protein
VHHIFKHAQLQIYLHGCDVREREGRPGRRGEGSNGGGMAANLLVNPWFETGGFSGCSVTFPNGTTAGPITGSANVSGERNDRVFCVRRRNSARTCLEFLECATNYPALPIVRR